MKTGHDAIRSARKRAGYYLVSVANIDAANSDLPHEQFKREDTESRSSELGAQGVSAQKYNTEGRG